MKCLRRAKEERKRSASNTSKEPSNVHSPPQIASPKACELPSDKQDVSQSAEKVPVSRISIDKINVWEAYRNSDDQARSFIEERVSLRQMTI